MFRYVNYDTTQKNISYYDIFKKSMLNFKKH